MSSNRGGGRPNSRRPRTTPPGTPPELRSESAPIRPEARPSQSTVVKSRPTMGGRKPPPKSDNTALFAIGGIVVVAVLALLAALFLFNGSNGGNNQAVFTPGPGDVPVAADPTAQVRNFPNQGQDHLTAGQTVQSLTNNQGYNSNPPTSGPHSTTWSRNGVFPQAVQDELLVHNLEHGSIIIHYYCPTECVGTVNALSNYARRYTPESFTGVILVPRSTLPDGARIALTSWQNRLLLKSFDREKLEQFISTYIGKGPERDPNFKP